MSYKWESEKIAQLRLKSRHGGLDENERLLYEDYLQSCALSEANVTASEARSMGRMSERQLKKSAMRRGVVSLALVAMFGMYAMTGCKLSESICLVPYTAYEIGYKLTGELPDTNKALSSIANMAKVRSSIPMPFSSDDCFFNEVVSRLRGTSDRTEVQRHMMTMLEGLPAFAFHSVMQSEPVYEAHWNDFPGIHIEQCGSGIHNWINLPNLVFGGNRPREQKNLEAAKADYDAAVALGMVMDSTNYPYQHIKSIFRLNKTQDVGSVTERWMIPEFEDYISNNLPDNLDELNIECCLEQLEWRGVISRVDLTQRGDNLSAIGSELPADFYYDYAWHTLRQMFHLWHAVKETIPYVAELSEAIQRKKARLL